MPVTLSLTLTDVEVFILSGDRDLFQLVQDNITIRIPKTKMIIYL